MKKIITLLVFCFAGGMVMAQTPALKVASNGMVGINNASPADLLHLTDVGTQTPSFIVEATASGATQNFVKAAAGTTASAFLYDDRNFFAIAPATSTGFNGDASSAANSFNVFGASGQVTIGTWSPLAGSKLDVRGGTIAHEGTVIFSDKRLKNNITNFDAGIEELMGLRTISYVYNGKGGTTEGINHIGIVAQDLQKVVPQLVQEVEHVEYTEISSLADERHVKSRESFLAIKDNEIKYLLINAIKDQQGIIEDQEARIIDLESRLSEITAGLQEISTQDVELSGTTAYLKQNAPNPFKEFTVIDYNIPASASTAQMNILDVNGKLLKEISLTNKGIGSVTLRASEIPSGFYSYNLVVDGRLIDTNKMVIQR